MCRIEKADTWTRFLEKKFWTTSGREEFIFQNLHDLFHVQSAVTTLALEKREQPPGWFCGGKREAVRGVRPELIIMLLFLQEIHLWHTNKTEWNNTPLGIAEESPQPGEDLERIARPEGNGTFLTIDNRK